MSTRPVPVSALSEQLATTLPLTTGSRTDLTRKVITLAMVGDVMLGRYVRDVMDRRGTAHSFAPVGDLLAEADIAFANLESPLTAALPVTQGHDLRAKPLAVEALVEAGFDGVWLANNHSTDCGRAGLLETMATLEEAGIAHVGAGRNRAEAHAALMIEVEGLRLAFLAYDDTGRSLMATADGAGSAWLDLGQAKADVAKAGEEADLVIVSLHWGQEYSSRPTDRQREVARELAAAGADIVVGHHPHVLQPLEWIRAGDHVTLVAYSLGNFLFDQYFSVEARNAAILRCMVDRSGVVGVSILPVAIGEDGQVQLSSSAEGETNLQRMLPDQEMSSWCAFAHTQGGYERWWLASYSPNSSRGPNGDLGGWKGRVELNDGTIRLHDGWKEVWLGDPSWDVYQATLADANNDGRVELAFVLWKPFAALPIDRFYKGPLLIEGNRNADEESCHLFLYALERGVLRPEWCSSALPNPIYEFAFGDVDGDGENELVALEGTYGDGSGAPARHLTIWRWNGWGFTLEWRSPPGDYHRLVLEDISGDCVLDIVVQDSS